MNIFNKTRRHLVMQTGWALSARGAHESPRDALLRELFATTTQFDVEGCPNSFLQAPLLDYARKAESKVLCIGYAQTDNGSHEGLYDLVLDSAHRFDPFVEHLWQTIQSLPQY